MTLSSRVSILKFIKLYFKCDKVFITHLVDRWHDKPRAYEYNFYMPEETITVTCEYNNILSKLNEYL